VFFCQLFSATFTNMTDLRAIQEHLLHTRRQVEKDLGLSAGPSALPVALQRQLQSSSRRALTRQEVVEVLPTRKSRRIESLPTVDYTVRNAKQRRCGSLHDSRTRKPRVHRRSFSDVFSCRSEPRLFQRQHPPRNELAWEMLRMKTAALLAVSTGSPAHPRTTSQESRLLAP
jgi:hypothetical protein